MKKKYPKSLRQIKSSEESIERRFLRACRGWIKYKPLFEYITNQENYKEKLKITYQKLAIGILEINKIFENHEFNVLLDDLKDYNTNVKKHYNEYLKINNIWNQLKIGNDEWIKNA